MGESEVNSQICLNNSLIKDNLTIVNEFLFYFFFSGNFPGCSVVKESAYQCRRHELDHWDGKIPWKRAWQPIPVFLLGKFHGQRSLAGYSPWGFKSLTGQLNNSMLLLLFIFRFISFHF